MKPQNKIASHMSALTSKNIFVQKTKRKRIKTQFTEHKQESFSWISYTIYWKIKGKKHTFVKKQISSAML